MIEQAVFTSAETNRLAGYQVVATSPGVSEADRRELAIWGPSHGSLIDESPDGVSFNFHPLSEGNYCISRTTLAGGEYSGRGHQVYTQCLVVPAEELARFANNPFAVLRAALAGGALEVHRRVPQQLEPLQLLGHSAAVDASLLSRLCQRPGPRWLATLVQAALSQKSLALVGSDETEHLIAGLLNCLPPECRTQFSFSTGLRYSPRRPFRLVTLDDDKAEWRQMERRHGATVLDLSQAPPDEYAPIDGWARLIERVLQAGNLSFLAAQFSKRRFELLPEDLPALGLQLLEESEELILLAKREEEKKAKSKPSKPTVPSDWLDGLQHAHSAHRQFGGSAKLSTVESTPMTEIPKPSQVLSPESPEVLEKLEMLDDLVFEAIEGKEDALLTLREIWPKLHDELGYELLAESREQYLYHALFIWQGSIEPGGVREASRAVAALEVLSILFDDA